MRSKAIIEAVALRHGLSVSEILGRTRSAAIVAARHDAIVSMKQARLPTNCIAEAIDLDISTVLYRANPNHAKRRKAAGAVKRPASVRVKIKPEYLPKLTQLAALTDGGMEAAVNKAVANMLGAA